MRRLVLALLLLAGCAGQFPTTTAGARKLFCEREACPAEEREFHSYLVEQSSDVDGCTCILTDGQRQFEVKVPYARW